MKYDIHWLSPYATLQIVIKKSFLLIVYCIMSFAFNSQFHQTQED